MTGGYYPAYSAALSAGPGVALDRMRGPLRVPYARSDGPDGPGPGKFARTLPASFASASCRDGHSTPAPTKATKSRERSHSAVRAPSASVTATGTPARVVWLFVCLRSLVLRRQALNRSIDRCRRRPACGSAYNRTHHRQRIAIGNPNQTDDPNNTTLPTNSKGQKERKSSKGPNRSGQPRRTSCRRKKRGAGYTVGQVPTQRAPKCSSQIARRCRTRAIGPQGQQPHAVQLGMSAAWPRTPDRTLSAH
jgi:hypothetical protein